MRWFIYVSEGYYQALRFEECYVLKCGDKVLLSNGSYGIIDSVVILKPY